MDDIVIIGLLSCTGGSSSGRHLLELRELAARLPADEISLVVWNDPDVDWSSYDLVVSRSVWDYWLDQGVAYAAALERITAATLVENPASLQRWNIDKRYLRDLYRCHVPVVPTAFIEPDHPIAIKSLLQQPGWDRVVVKPAVSAGGEHTTVTDRKEQALIEAHVADCLTRGVVMIQPYLRAIETDGEVSMIFIDGELCHAVRKIPAPGKFLTQFKHGTEVRTTEPTPAEIDVARQTFDAIGAPLLFARIDTVLDSSGQPVLMEAELIEPWLYAETNTAVYDRMASAISRRVADHRPPAVERRM